MRFVLYLIFTFITLSSCVREPVIDIDKLLELDSMVTHYPKLNSFSSLKLYTKQLNGVAICDSNSTKCKPDEKHYTIVLDSLDISTQTFDLLVSKMDLVPCIKFYRYGYYSVWVENGAFGDIYGYLINHNPSISKIQSFELDNRYHIGVGKKVRENVYYFSSNYD